MIRDTLSGDWAAIWPIFEEIVRAGDAYAYPADTDKPTAEALWMTKPERTFVFEHDGKILAPITSKPTRKDRVSMSVTAATWCHPSPAAWVSRVKCASTHKA